ncbi:hypothetical protein BDP27DRAFT_1336807 [Rhodocollybia butyracea]|uniref:F-box domain-containing protein n=1 Tax=Rhodocollybia butyracea TaxID=206335 RepID=A0A9P5PHT5_9AGAR|nr:hypothetical protein BDP27DRAFT_1336807 [Rhodocollybia butyracea]
MPLSHAAEYYLGLVKIEGPVDLPQSDISALQTFLSELEALPEQTNYLDHISHSKSPEIAAKIDGSIQPLSTVIVMLRNILSPIRRVPLEILSYIFVLVCSTDFIDYDAGHILAVGGVCKAWRNALYAATPRVWSTFFVNISSHWNLLLDDDAPSVKQWLTRSLGMPLDIELVFTVPEDDSDCGPNVTWRPVNAAFMHKAKCVIDSVIEFSQQIRSIQVKASTEVFPLLTCFNELEFPLLETISLTILVESNIQAFSPDTPISLLNAPKLCNARLVEPVNPSRPVLDSFHIPLSQLTSLSLDLRSLGGHSDPQNGLAEVLLECQNLITLRILTGRCYAALTLSPPVHLPCLRSLELSYHSATLQADNRDSLLKYITAPTLEHLTLRCDVPYRYVVDGSNLVDFQTRSSISLRSLNLVEFHLSRADELSINFFENRVIPILAACPTVHSFEMALEEYVQLNLLFKAMTYTKGQPVILPYITHLSLGATEAECGCKHDWYCPSELVHMIQSRIQGEEESNGVVVARLQKVVLTDVGRTAVNFQEIYNLPNLEVHVEAFPYSNHLEEVGKNLSMQ